MSLSNTIVMETGGMKGRREELTRKEVHDILKKQWQLNQVHSEYGMTELLSQAYAPADGIFKPAATMQVLVRDINDPLEVMHTGQGGLNIVDLANIHSCSFIATEDIGKLAPMAHLKCWAEWITLPSAVAASWHCDRLISL